MAPGQVGNGQSEWHWRGLRFRGRHSRYRESWAGTTCAQLRVVVALQTQLQSWAKAKEGHLQERNLGAHNKGTPPVPRSQAPGQAKPAQSPPPALLCNTNISHLIPAQPLSVRSTGGRPGKKTPRRLYWKFFEGRTEPGPK